MHIELGGIIDGVFRRNLYIEENDILSVNKFKNKCKNTDMYYSAYKYSDLDIDNSLLSGPLYLDLDIDIKTEEDFKKVLKDTIYIVTHLEMNFGIPQELINIYFSGSKGFHIMIDQEVLGIEDCNDLNEKYKIVATYLNNKCTIYKTIDTRIYDKKRLFRFVNSINSKTGLYKIRLNKNELKNLTIDSIADMAINEREYDKEQPRLINKAKKEFNRLLLINELQKSKKKILASKSKYEYDKQLLPCTQEALNSGAEKGNRNNTLVLLASSMFQKGLDENEVMNNIDIWNSKNSSPLSNSEVVNTIKSAESMVKIGKTYGCSAYKDLGLCIGDKCKLFKK